MAHISNKFNSEIRKITETMLDTASQTKLGSEVVQKHRKGRGAQKLTSNDRGDAALISLNQNLVELDRLQLMKKKDGMMTEHDFNEYEDEILRELPS